MKSNSIKSEETDFFALWEKKRSKAKIVFTKESDVKSIEEIANTQKSYTQEDELRRTQIYKAKEELALLSTNRHTQANKLTSESYNKKRNEFINIKKILQAEMNTDRYTRAV